MLPRFDPVPPKLGEIPPGAGETGELPRLGRLPNEGERPTSGRGIGELPPLGGFEPDNPPDGPDPRAETPPEPLAAVIPLALTTAGGTLARLFPDTFTEPPGLKEGIGWLPRDDETDGPVFIGEKPEEPEITLGRSETRGPTNEGEAERETEGAENTGALERDTEGA